MGSMGTTGEADGVYTMDGIYYFEERARGGAGLIITGANVVSTKYEPRPCTELSIFHHVERLNMLIDRCHHYGVKVCVQLSPGLGRQQFTDPFTSPYSAGVHLVLVPEAHLQALREGRHRLPRPACRLFGIPCRGSRCRRR